MRRVRKELSRTYAREMEDGVFVQGRARDVRLVDIALTRRGVTAEIEIDGSIEVHAATDARVLFAAQHER